MMALVLVAVMMMAMSVTAFAADGDPDYSITVNNAKEGETYSAYKMFDLSVDDPTNPSAYRYTVNSAWADFADTDAFKAVFTVDDQGYVTSTESDQATWSATSKLSIVADAAAKFAKDHNITAAGSVTIDEGETSGKIELTTAGYYVVSSTLGSRAMIETTPSDSAVTINEKNETDTIEKKVKEDSTGDYGESNDDQIGKTVEFKSEATIAARSINVKIHDTMDNGLTFSGNSSIKIYTDAALTTELASTLYEIQDEPDSGETFTIKIKDAFAAEATASQKLYITYTAVINKNAIVNSAIVDQKNKTQITYGDDQSVESETTTTVHKFSVYKHAKNSNDNLADAIFQLKKGNDVVYLIKIDANTYRVADATEATTTAIASAATHVAANNEVATVAANTLVSDFVTVASNDIVILGVDADDDNAKYTITELQAPKGYNLLADPQSVEVNTGNTTRVDVENATGTELPSTGGIGTTIFYVIGAILVIGAGVLLVTKRRMGVND